MLEYKFQEEKGHERVFKKKIERKDKGRENDNYATFQIEYYTNSGWLSP